MRKTQTLHEAVLLDREGHGPLRPVEIRHFGRAEGLATRLPAQVAEVLLKHGRIADPRVPPGAAAAGWIAERDWVYRIPFRVGSHDGPRVLRALGLDTLADLYLDGRLLARSENYYLPLRVVLPPLPAGEHVLLVHFHAVPAWLAANPLPPDLVGLVHPNRLLRKPHEDFNGFHGAHPCFTPVGIRDQVLIDAIDSTCIASCSVGATLPDLAAPGQVEAIVTVDGEPPPGSRLRLRVLDRDGDLVAAEEIPVERSGSYDLLAGVDQPRLWWPRGHGPQHLHDVRVELIAGRRMLDVVERRVGFRTLAMDDRFALRVNDQVVRLWGANLAPLDQFTHVWSRERARRVLDLADRAYAVTLRLWGPGAPYGDDLMDACDERGILLWSELHHTWGMYPDDPAFTEQCRLEALHHVHSLRHHPSIFMWCGANEVVMGSELSHPGRTVRGRRILEETYRTVFQSIDPSRPYRPDSPIGGAWANDPRVGDTHGYTHFWFVPGTEYPAMLSENARWSPPGVKTLRRYLPDTRDFWPTGFISRVRHRRAPAAGPGSPSSGLGNDGRVDTRDFHDDGLIPRGWQQLGKDGNVTNPRVGPIGDFHETGDTPEGLVYRIGSAHALFLRRELERLRRGRPGHDARGPRRCNGHYWWRLNGTWPLIDSELVDYLGEPKMAYFAWRRSQAPVLLSFAFGDSVVLWATNDSGRQLEGVVEVALLPMDGSPAVHRESRRVTLPHDASEPVLDLDAVGMFRRELVLVARLLGDDGKVLAATSDFATEERNLVFPDAVLDLVQVGRDSIQIGCAVFARSVELAAEATADGDPFGWDFEDNHFDLLPGEPRRVRILGDPRAGTVSARSFHGTTTSAINFSPE